LQPEFKARRSAQGWPSYAVVSVLNMNLLSVNGLSKSFGAKVLFSKINFGIAHGEKVALVAKNGSGKTTLFKIIKGIEIADEGEVVFRKNIRVAFLDQDFTLDESATIRNVVEEADNPYVQAVKAYNAAVAESERIHNDATAQRLDEALHTMNELDAWSYEQEAAEILARLGIHDTSQVISTLSGGQKKRVALALVLITKPDLLVMDEPTNHLDLDMIEWLERYLQNAALSLLLVTHDRYFLDAVCDRILELDGTELFEYRGDFEYFLTKKAERESVRAAEIDKAKNLYRRELEWIRRMPKARGTKAKSRVDAFDEIAAKARQKRTEKKIELSVKMERLGSKTVELHKVTKKFGDKNILNPFTYTFITGEKIGVVGKNGVGKSTLLRMILGEEQPDSGKVVIGDTVVFGHYSQGGIQLSNDKRILEVVRDIAEFIPLANGQSLSASQLLTRFNFPPEAQYSYVSKLSGGEKRRLYLLTILMKNPNFLILDEPTNDLDIVTLQTLEEFLDDFKGCVLMVSHDRYFMDRLADHIFAFEGDGEIKDFPGNYTEYREWKSEQRPEPEIQKTLTQAEPTPAEKTRTTSKLSFKVQRELEELEKDIPALEARKKELENELSRNVSDYGRIREISAELQEISGRLDEKSLRWLEIQEEL
jgi:ABC transport system ATP-binding/permease protein